MIFVDRSSVPEPAKLKPLREAGLRHARAFFVDTPVRERRQTRYFNPYWQKAYKVPIPALGRLFHGKCAYCESKVDLSSPGVVDHLRPKWATRGLGREYAADHYWWLAFAWDNLYLACPQCNKHRGQRFPVKGKRINGPDQDVSAEKPLLLDPCNPSDVVNEHLRFEESGYVKPLSARGEVTINLFALNRSDLVARRKAMTLELKDLWLAVSDKLPKRRQPFVLQLNALVDSEAQYSACAKQILQSHLSRAGVKEIKGLAIAAQADVSRRRRVVQSRTIERTPRFIDEIRLRNFRGITHLRLRTPSSEQSAMDWLMLIGENAAGKSSILQAIALNLMSDTERDGLRLDHRPFIRRGARSARVEICFRGGGETRVLTIAPRSGFKCSDAKAAAPIMAYGATRLPPRNGAPARGLPLENLFNPFTPLRDAVDWLAKLEKARRADFDYAARALKSLLPGKRDYRFRVLKGNVIVDPEGPLQQLSDGYQSVVTLAADIMATLHHSFRGGMEAAEGIVLLDELGAHLHPRWKMRLTRILRQVFPRFQFIVTTHDPLCLRGLRNGEIVTIEKTPRGRVFARTDLPPIEGMRVDQILQSEYFGLRSAMDPDVEAKFERMYRLKAKPPSTLTPQQHKEISGLEEQLAPLEVLGSTRAERLMLSEINRFLAVERTQPTVAAREESWATAQRQIASRLEKELGIQL